MDINYQKILIYIVIIILACLLTVFTFDTWQTVVIVAVLLLAISALFVFSIDRLTTYNVTNIKEGFITESASESSSKEVSEAIASKYEWLSNDDLFDDFYASVFTKLTQNEKLIQAETAICMEEFTKNTPKDQLIILDAGCGIGIGTTSFAKQGAGQVVGIDKSQAMIRYAKGTTMPSTTLNDLQKQNVEFRQFDLMGPGAAQAAEFTNAVLLYFTVYYFRDLETLFRNLALWVKPGGSLVIEVVNKYKFEPILDSSNPWVGFSPQKYTKERVTKSKVVFDKFDYEADFELNDPKAEFRETFRFKDGSVRRQKHTLYMPSMPDIIKKAQNNGWTYTKYVDLTSISFPYGYLLFFSRNAE
jgi:SAM-dependent methyltransferase